MKNLRIFLSLALFLSFTGGCRSKEIHSQDRLDAERIIGLMQTRFSQALTAKNLDELVSLYANNAALYDEDGPTIRGKNAIREAWKLEFARPGLSMNTLPGKVEISDDGGLAWAHGTFRNRTDLSGESTSDQWRYTLIFKKLPEGWKIWADSAYADLQNHLSRTPPKGRSAWAPLAPLIGLACLISTLWFASGMPIVTAIYAWRAIRNKTWPTGLIVSLSMLLAFFLAAALLWIYISGHYWNLPLKHAILASTDTERYGNPLEDSAEAVLVNIMIFSAISGLAAGILARTVCWLTRTRHRAGFA